MKIQSRKALLFAGRAGAGLVRAIVATSKVRECVEDPDWHPYMGGAERNFLLAAWHENLLLAAWYCGRFAHFDTLASPSRDGEIITGCASSLGLNVHRGSSKDGGARALRLLVDLARTRRRFRCVITPDGPRGPRRSMSPGVAYIAARSGLPVVSLGIACENSWRARSWDRLQIPKPFRRMQFYLTAPRWPAANLARGGLDAFAEQVRGEIDRAQDRAEALLKAPIAGGRRRVALLRQAA